ncbi:ABC transporter permease subunit [Spirillospora sp. NPDC127200]
MTIALRLLADRRRSVAWWTIAVAGLVLFTVSLYPSLKQQASVDELVAGLPETFRTMVGYQAGVPLTSPAGFLNARLFATVLPVLVLVLGIGAGARAIGGAEEEGTLEPMLANPVSRRRVAAERYAATLLQLAAVVAASTAALLAIGPAFGALDGIATTTLAGASAAVFTLALTHTTLAFAVGAATGRRGPAVAAAAAVAVTGYLAQNLLTAGGTGGSVRWLSPWSWYLDGNILTDGPSPAALWAPLPVTAVLFTVGTAWFCRRDLR